MIAHTCLIENFERLKAQKLQTIAQDKFGNLEILKNAHETIGGRSSYFSYTYITNGFCVMDFSLMHSYITSLGGDNTLASCLSLYSLRL